MQLSSKIILKDLDYLVLDETLLPKSISVYDSDVATNGVAAFQVIGTLARPDSSSRIVPYLAESWRYDAENNEWEFTLRKNLKTDQGIAINAQNYVDGLHRVLKKLVTNSLPPTFKHLVGFNLFLNGSSSISGIDILSEYKFKFIFERKVSGVLEFLSMPYYGFHSPHNFIGSEWKNAKQVDSSSNYRVKSWNDGQLVLEKRELWPLISPNAPINVHFRSVKQNQLYLIKTPSIISTDLKLPELSNFYEVNSLPSFWSGIAISTDANPILSRLEVREFIRDKIIQMNSLANLDIANSYKAKSFYPSSDAMKVRAPVEKISVPESLLDVQQLTIATRLAQGSDRLIYAKKILEQVFKDTKVELEWIFIDKSKKGWFEKYTSNKDYDLRLTSVNSGSYPINWVVEMMFCSQLGISFSDPSKRMSRLVEKYSKEEISNERYLTEFESVAYEDSAVINLLHSSIKWYVSNEIDPASFIPTSGSVLFDDVKMKK